MIDYRKRKGKSTCKQYNFYYAPKKLITKIL